MGNEKTENEIIVDRLKFLSDAVTKGCDSIDRNFHMSIPARPMEDADLVLSKAASIISRLSNPDRIINQVLTERDRQDEKWGGSLNDDEHDAMDWHRIISDYNGWARTMAMMNFPEKTRRRYIQIAALAIAAVESMDRFSDASDCITDYMKGEKK